MFDLGVSPFARHVLAENVGPVSPLSSGKTLLSFVDVRDRWWLSGGPQVVPANLPYRTIHVLLDLDM